MRLVIGVTGASGVIYALRLLEVLRGKGVESHLIISRTAESIIKIELNMERKDFESYATYSYEVDDLCASIASGTFKVDGVIIIPCSMGYMASIAHGFSNNLITRVADVALKEGRKMVLVPRETPLNENHLRNMLKLCRMGACILPAMPAYYQNPKKVGDLVDFIVGKVLDQLNIAHNLYEPWRGLQPIR